MGVDLSLMPVDYHRDSNECTAFSLLRLERRSELWGDIEKLPVTSFKALTGHCGGRFETVTTDPYGSELTYATASDLLTLENHPAVQDNEKNRAIWAYLGKLRPDHKIALYWS